MLSFERILQVFDDILRQDPLYEVVSTSHGYTLRGWAGSRTGRNGTAFFCWTRRRPCWTR